MTQGQKPTDKASITAAQEYLAKLDTLVDELVNTKKSINIAGPMCAGKTTLQKALAERLPDAHVFADAIKLQELSDLFSDPKVRQQFYADKPAIEARSKMVWTTAEWLMNHFPGVRIIFTAWFKGYQPGLINIFLTHKDPECIRNERYWPADMVDYVLAWTPDQVEKFYQLSRDDVNTVLEMVDDMLS